MVRGRGFEPLTPSVSVKCSTTELIAHHGDRYPAQPTSTLARLNSTHTRSDSDSDSETGRYPIPMKIESLHLGMQVRHPQYGLGTVKAISSTVAEIEFAGETHSIAPEPAGLMPAEAQAAVSGLSVPLNEFIEETTAAAVRALGLERPDSVDVELGSRWHKGKVALHPADPTLQTKDIPMETFFHKIVMVRNNLRVLEQKVNAHDGLSDADKVELQQYITRSYGSLTTFNVLFKDKEEQF